MKTYNLNDNISVKLFPSGEKIYLDYRRQYSKERYISEHFRIGSEYDYTTHIWTGQLHTFMGIFGCSMIAGGTSSCETTIRLLVEPKKESDPVDE